MPDFPRLRLDSRGFGVYGSFAVCVLVWTSRIPPGRVPHSERLYARESRSTDIGGGQWPRWFYCARGAAPNDIEDLEDASFAFDGSIGSLIQNAAHLAVAFGRAFAVVHARAFFLSWALPLHETRFFAAGKVAAVAPTSAMICCAESTPRPGTSAGRSTAS